MGANQDENDDQVAELTARIDMLRMQYGEGAPSWALQCEGLSRRRYRLAMGVVRTAGVEGLVAYARTIVKRRAAAAQETRRASIPVGLARIVLRALGQSTPRPTAVGGWRS